VFLGVQGWHAFFEYVRQEMCPIHQFLLSAVLALRISECLMRGSARPMLLHDFLF
jgi:hypothetical protein